MTGKQLVDYGITALIVYVLYKVFAPIAMWLVNLIPTLAITVIIVGCLRMYREK